MAKKEAKSVAEAILAEPVPRKYVPKHGGAPVEESFLAPVPEDSPVKAKAVPAPKRADLSKFSTDGDLVDIWERRMLNPNHQESNAVRIKTPGMKLRWINLANRGRFQRARYEQGWVPCHQNELMDEREIYGVSYTTEGFVCRGEKQSEMLMKIPIAVYKKIQARRQEMNDLSYKKLRQSMGAAGSTHFKEKYSGSAGDQAEEIANSLKGEIKFGTETVSSTELFE